MSIVSELLDHKGRNVWTISADSSVYDAVVLMSEKNIGALIVTSDSSMLAGIISERDYARNIVIKDKSSKSTLVSEIMTEEVVFAKEDTLLDRCMSLMAQKKIRHLRGCCCCCSHAFRFLLPAPITHIGLLIVHHVTKSQLCKKIIDAAAF